MSQSPLISAAEASFRYAGQSAFAGPFDFELRPGELHFVCGPSGCGKSTLARIATGLIPHLYRGELRGSVHAFGRPTHSYPLWQLTSLAGLVSQNPAAQLLASTVQEEIIFGLENLGLPPREIEARLETALAAFGLKGLAERDPRTLSGGEQQKLILAAVMARRPQALVLDEPLSMLDTTSALAVVGHLERLAASGCAVTVFEHRRAYFDSLKDLRRLELPSPAPAQASELAELPRSLPAFRLSVDGLAVERGGRQVLRGIDLELAGGQVVALVGANASGKTTLLRALAGLQPHTGRITGFVSGSGLGPRLGLVFQNPDRQIFNPTVRQEILYGLPDHDPGFYRSVVRLLGLSAYEDTPPLLLSEGEKKRLALATVLLRPGLRGICLDEPTLGQDERHRRLLGQILTRLAAAGYLCLVATHDLAWALEWSGRLLMLREGRLIGSGKPAVFERQEFWAQAGLILPQGIAKRCDADGHSR